MSSEHTCDLKYLYVALNIASRLKTTLEKLVVAVNHLIKFDTESDTVSSCDAVGSLLALCPETNWDIRVVRQDYVSI